MVRVAEVLNHLLERDPSLHELLDLASDWEAERVDEASPWERKPCPVGEGR
jgi:hypothetical protein